MLAMSAVLAELKVDKEFESLCPKLTPEEEAMLRTQIQEDGCRDAIVTWANHDDTIIDGYNRYRICRETETPFRTKALKLDSRNDAISWIIKNQLGRRNLNETQRATMAARLVTAKVGGDHSANLPNGDVTTKQAAELCNVSARSVTDAKKVLQNGTPALKEAIKEGTIPVSTAAVVSELPKQQQTKIVKQGPKAAQAAAKQVKETKKHKDEFDTAKLDKQKRPKNGAVKGFDHKPIDDLFGKIVRAVDRHEAEVGRQQFLYKKCRDTLEAAFGAWKELRRA
jgi:hypothetical protein